MVTALTMPAAAWLPNAITVFRLLLVAPVAACLWWRAYDAALVLFAFAAASDAADGWLARRLHSTSRFGAMADPLADKALSLTVFVLLAAQAALPAYVVAVVVARDVVIVGGAVAFRLLFGPFEYAPSLAGKVSTGCQLGLLLVVLLRLALGSDAASLQALQQVAVACVLAAAAVSGADYVITWSRRARARRAGGAR
jgi:cardiolipin synthase